MDGFGCLAFLLLLVGFAIAIIAIRKASRLEGEVARLSSDSASIRGRLARLETQLRHGHAAESPAPGSAPQPFPEESPAPETTAPPFPVEPAFAHGIRPEERPIVEESSAIPPVNAEEAPPVFVTFTAPPPAPPPEQGFTRFSAPQSESAFATEPPHPPPPPSSEPPPVPPPPRPPASPTRGFDWESLVGVKLFSWIAGIALALAAVFFLKYSVDHGWLRPVIRMAMGLLTGSVLLVVCEMRIARHYRVTANAMNAAGIAILYSTLFASYSRWHLMPILVVFVLMALVTAVAVLLSIRRDSVFIALLGLVGGFATPALLSTGEDRPFGLFGYLLLLNVGLAWVAYRKRWPVLSVLTLVFTTFYQWAWVAKFLTGAKLPIAIAIFLIFPIATVISYWIGRRDTSGDSVFEKTAAMSAVLPLMFAVYGAAVPAYGSQTTLLFFFLLCVDVGLAFIAGSRRGPELLHLAGGVGTAAVFLVWSAMSYRSGAWPSILAWIAAFVLLYAITPLVMRRVGREFASLGRDSVLTAPALLFVFGVLAGIEPRAANPVLLFTILFGLLAIISAIAIRFGDARIYSLGAFFTLVALAVWSSKHLTPPRVNQGLLLYLVFALFFLGVPFLARRFNRPLRLTVGGPVLLYLMLGLLFFLAVGVIANVSLFAITFLLLVVIVGMALEPTLRERPWVIAGAILLSWFILGVWWISATLTTLLVPALLAIAGFTVLTTATQTVLQKQAGEEKLSSAFGDGLYLGLVGHGFLIYVASQRQLSVPPWPMFGVLAVLVLAIGVASLYARRPNAHLASLVATQVILLVWEETARFHPWPSIAMFATGVLTLLAIAWYVISRRPGTTLEQQNRFAIAAAITAVLGQIVALVAEELPGLPVLPLVVGTHLLLILALLRLAWVTEWHVLSIIAIPASSLAYYLWRSDEYDPVSWTGEMLFATVIYLAFIVYPLLLGGRARRTMEPYLAAILASIPYFFFSRTSWMWRGWEDALGLLPILQAGLMSLLLIRLVRMEPAGDRALSRLALVAAATLGFITVAIPLQLDKEWITIGWALEAAALIWLYRRIPHRGLVAWSVGLAVTVFVRLVFNPAVLAYHPRSATPILNWYLYTYLIPAAALFTAAWLIPRDEISGLVKKVRPLYSTFATVLLFLLLNIEIADFYSKGGTITFNFNAGLAQDLTYTLGWALFAIAMLIAGIALQNRATRVASLALLVVSVLKCFLHDLMRLGGLYRVGSLVGLAISLALVAVLLQRFVMVRREAQAS